MHITASTPQSFDKIQKDNTRTHFLGGNNYISKSHIFFKTINCEAETSLHYKYLTTPSVSQHNIRVALHYLSSGTIRYALVTVYEAIQCCDVTHHD